MLKKKGVECNLHKNYIFIDLKFAFVDVRTGKINYIGFRVHA